VARGMLRVLVNGTLPGYFPGQIVEIQADEEGTPLDFYWRRRFADAKADGGSVVVLPDEDPSPAAVAVDEESAE
jgi:hypothetical protein